MGVKDLWQILTPYCERKPIYELQGKIVAIDLAGWVCESLNVVDYFIHPRQYLKNLFFRTCYLLLAGVIPVFVLDGKAPEMKQATISKRNELQFRGVRPRKESSKKAPVKNKKGRTRFNHVLKQCENLLISMGLECLHAPGEAEAFCAYLNMKGLVDGVISQDSDCFAYGARKVFRNFSVSSQGTSSAQGGAVDIYDMEKVCQSMDFGQNKIVVMALLCGCDYCPDGVGGVGKDAVVKLFTKYKNVEILDRIKSWRANDRKYTELEMRVDDKNVCSNCGHLGKTLSHTKCGCSVCRTTNGCDSSLWREERLALKAELAIRKKALTLQDFPSQEIIDEFLIHPENIPNINLQWKQPNLVKFIKIFSDMLQWSEIYSFQKFIPLLTRWQIFHFGHGNRNQPSKGFLYPDFIKKKRTPKGVPSYEIIWKDEEKLFDGLIPDDQIKSYFSENPNGMESLWSTIEPVDLTEKAYPSLVENFISKQKKPKASKKKTTEKKKVSSKITKPANDSLNNMSDFLEATEEIEKTLKKRKKPQKLQNQLMDKFLIEKCTPTQSKKRTLQFPNNCSTPKALCPSDLDDDRDDNDFNFSEIIQGIISKRSELVKFEGKRLKYDKTKYVDRSFDDLDLLPKKKRGFQSISPIKPTKRMLLSDEHGSFNSSFSLAQDDINVNGFSSRENVKSRENLIDRFLIRESAITKNSSFANVSYFFEKSIAGADEFERSLDINLKMDEENNRSSSSDESCVIID